MVVEREQEEQLTLFTPFPRIRFIPETVAREELLRPCGRFHSVVPKETRLIGAIRERLLARERDDSFVSVPGMPLSWRAMLEYLHEHELIAEPGFHLPLFDNSHPKTFSLRLRPYPDKDSTDARNATYNAFASGRDIERVMERVVGEVLERRFLRQYHASDLVAASADEMRGRGLDLDTLNGFAPFQLEAVPLGARDDHAPLLWERGYEVQTGRRTYLPAQLVYWSYAQGKDGERILGDSTTSGCAGHFTREEALLSALLELIERDGFLIYWLNMLSPRVIEVARSPDPSIRRLLAYLERYRIRPYFLDTTTDIGIPSLVCVVVDELSGSRIGIGGACGFDLARMVTRASEEALSVYRARMQPEQLPEDYRPFLDTTVTLGRRRALWQNEQMLAQMGFFLRGGPIAPDDFMRPSLRAPAGAQAQLSYVSESLASLGTGYEPYAYEVRDPVLNELGYHVVRCIVPQLVPLYLREHLATLDAPRLSEVPGKLGFEPAKTLNRTPHPFL